MNVLLAIRDQQILKRSKRILRALSYDFSMAKDLEDLRAQLSQRLPDAVLVDAYIDDVCTLDLIREFEVAWFVLMAGIDSWGVAYYISRLGPRVAAFSPGVGVADLLEAFECAHDADYFAHLRMLNTGNWLTSIQQFPGGFNDEPNVVDASAHLAQKLVLRSRFRTSFPASCTSSSMLGVMCRLMRKRQSGWLVLKRQSFYFRVLFKNGLPAAIDSNTNAVDVYSFAALEGFIRDEEVEEARAAGTSALPEYAKIEKMWFNAILMEAVTWITGEVDFVPDRAENVVAKFSVEEMNRIFEKAVFAVPCREQLDVVRAALPFKVTLACPADEALKLFSNEDSKAVVERLKKNDTLAELLVYLPQGYPVHQTIYLLLAQGCLDIE